MILKAILDFIIAPVVSLVINFFPTLDLGASLTPYVTSAVLFFADLFSFISYFVPMDLFLLAIELKLAFYLVKFIISLIRYVGEIL